MATSRGRTKFEGRTGDGTVGRMKRHACELREREIIRLKPPVDFLLRFIGEQKATERLPAFVVSIRIYFDLRNNNHILQSFSNTSSIAERNAAGKERARRGCCDLSIRTGLLRLCQLDPLTSIEQLNTLHDPHSKTTPSE